MPPTSCIATGTLRIPHHLAPIFHDLDPSSTIPSASCLTNHPLLPSSRTPVTVFSASSSYRFFGYLSPESPHGPSPSGQTQPPDHGIVLRFGCRDPPGDLPDHAGGYAANFAPSSRGRMLLSLFGITCANGVRQDVRPAQIRFALVGHFLRQAAASGSERQTRRQPPTAPSRPCRARAEPA